MSTIRKRRTNGIRRNPIWWDARGVRGWKGVPNLYRLYARYNRKFFASKLPKPQIGWAIFRDQQVIGRTYEVRRNRKYTGPLILIAWGVGDATELPITMLHEMVHVEEQVSAQRSTRRCKGNADYHPSSFHRRMVELLRRGALKGVI